jgi:bifunctional oligoribonuclease and PAP phosphatase NrnA
MREANASEPYFRQAGSEAKGARSVAVAAAGPSVQPCGPALGAAAAMLRAAERVWLGTHLDPDGDAIGSLLGLGLVLADLGKRVTLACQDPAPPEVAFLPELTRISDGSPAGDDIAIALDVADPSRLGRLYDPADWQTRPTIVVDHHASNPGFGTINVIDPAAAATAELVVALADELGAPISPVAATCLLAAVVTDTIGFRTPNTRPATLDCARRLMSGGASLVEITQHVFFTRPLAALQLLGRAVGQLEVDGPFAVACLRLADFAEFGMPASSARGIAELLATAGEPLVVALLREREDGTIDVSFRAKPAVDVLPAALALGGGGHPQAAGARWTATLEEASAGVWEALRRYVRLPSAEFGGERSRWR